MASRTAFVELMHALLRQYGMSPPDGNDHEVYTLTFSPQEVLHFHHGHPQWLDVIASAGRISSPHEAGVLIDLLELNRFRPATPSVCVAVDRESGLVFIWACHLLEALHLDRLHTLVQRFQEQLAAARLVLERNRSATAGVPDRVASMPTPTVKALLKRRSNI